MEAIKEEGEQEEKVEMGVDVEVDRDQVVDEELVF
jgi:hypothetical protein